MNVDLNRDFPDTGSAFHDDPTIFSDVTYSGMVRYAKTKLSVSCLTIKFISCFIVDRVNFFGKISCFSREFSSLIFDFLRPFESLFRFILVKIP